MGTEDPEPDEGFLEFEYTQFQEAETDEGIFARPRPYLQLVLTGPNGRPEPIRGIVDTGADLCVLPAAYLDLLDYRMSDLVDGDLEQAEGSGSVRLADTRCHAHVDGLDEIPRYPFVCSRVSSPACGPCGVARTSWRRASSA